MKDRENLEAMNKMLWDTIMLLKGTYEVLDHGTQEERLAKLDEVKKLFDKFNAALANSEESKEWLESVREKRTHYD